METNLSFEQIRELLVLFDKSSLSSMTIKRQDAVIKMRRDAKPLQSGNTETARPQILPEPYAIDEPVTIIPAEKTDTAPGNIVRSPIVGTFYRRVAPDAKPFVSEGSRVSVGNVLCIVEAMKVMNEITSKFDGEIVEVLAQDGQLVEYNQPLFRIV